MNKQFKYILYILFIIALFGSLVFFMPLGLEYLKQKIYIVLKWVLLQKWYFKVISIILLPVFLGISGLILEIIRGIFVSLTIFFRNILSFNYTEFKKVRQIQDITLVISLLFFTLHYWFYIYSIFITFNFWLLITDIIFFFSGTYILKSIFKKIDQFYLNDSMPNI